MPRPFSRPLRRAGARLLTRRGLRGAGVATAATVATALLTAGSQAPGLQFDAGRAGQDDGLGVPGGFVGPDVPLPDVPSQGDDSYHVELPPLKGVSAAEKVWGKEAVEAAGAGGSDSARRTAAEAGLPVSVFAAYRDAAKSVAGTDPGCGLRWELLAGIGKVESGHARGGAVDANGDTLGRITGPALDGNGFALIHDSEGGAWDGDAVYDRAVGPMQFLPTTWKSWGADGNGDGVANPNNIFDAALAAGHYLCAGDRDLRTAAGLERAVLSYNHSRDYLNLVLGWMEFYLRGVHTVPDGRGVVPESPGAGSDTPATKPVGEGGSGHGRGDSSGGAGTPTRAPGASPAPGGGGRPGSPAPSPSAPASGSPSATPGPKPSASPGGSPSPKPTGTSPAPSPDGSAGPSPSPTSPAPEPSTGEPTAPEPGDTASPTPTGSPEPSPSESESGAPDPGATDMAGVGAET
ncbi:lytic transglycosylase domain-containing protein [Streptomyces sp. AC558_RSS880]|uniref:lytic transglycosylase domain-containing protein n=1 Tax=Streptomyces sp. AC558_RSS880 TaxID=2823687 RepID=UPI001C230622|nr:hypothetical protein [Streptomyces sp. AC558_RSS880]